MGLPVVYESDEQRLAYERMFEKIDAVAEYPAGREPRMVPMRVCLQKLKEEGRGNMLYPKKE